MDLLKLKFGHLSSRQRVELVVVFIGIYMFVMGLLYENVAKLLNHIELLEWRLLSVLILVVGIHFMNEGLFILAHIFSANLDKLILDTVGFEVEEEKRD